MDPSVTSRDEIQDVPVELNTAALATSDGNESRDCSFMKIAVGQSPDYLCLERKRQSNVFPLSHQKFD